MQLDQTHIAIRERSFLELMDLALRVVRGHAGPLLLAWLVGVAPCAALNHWLLIPWAGHIFNDVEFPMSYVWYGWLLTLWEIPLATAPLTIYLGQMLFNERPRASDVARMFFTRLGQLLWYQIAIRGMGVLFLVWALWGEAGDDALILLSFWCVLSLGAIYLWWPHLNEVLLLERNPWRKPRGGMNTRSRSMALHGPLVGELLGRTITSLLFGALLVLALWLSQINLRHVLSLDARRSIPRELAEMQLAIWLVVGYLAVVRFLSYLDIRIRSEGWEVELAMRAEGARVTRQKV